MDTTNEARPVCPQCQGVLEKVGGILFFSMPPCDGYICRPCKKFYTDDLKPLADLIG